MRGSFRQRVQDERGAVLVAGLLLALALLIVIGACGVRKVGSGGVVVFMDESTEAVAPLHVV